MTSPAARSAAPLSTFRTTPGEGPVVVGEGGSLDFYRAFRWIPEEGRGVESFRWTAAGGMVGLGDLPGGIFQSSATSVTADGSVVVGGSATELGFEPYIWDQKHGMRRLAEVLRDDHGLDLAGWLLQTAAISDDGSSLVGRARNPNGEVEAWLVTELPEPSSLPLLVLGLFSLGAARRVHG